MNRYAWRRVRTTKRTEVDDVHVWFWAWVAIAVLLALGEAVTGGLLVLPWAIGAATAAILDALGVSIGWQWIAFLGVSSVLVVAAQRVIVQRRS